MSSITSGCGGLVLGFSAGMFVMGFLYNLLINWLATAGHLERGLRCVGL